MPVFHAISHKNVALLLLAFSAGVGLVRLAAMTPACAARNDFAHYYISSRALLEGENPYRVSLERRYAQRGFEFDERIPHATNPPALLWLLAPLAALRPLYACIAWQTLQLSALSLTLWLTWVLTRRRLTATGMAVVAVAVIFSNPLYWHVYHAQVQLLLGTMLLAAFWLNGRQRHHTACALVAAAGLLKLFPLALLPWFLWNTGERWPTKAKRAAAVATGIGAAVLLTGPLLWSEFIHRGLDVVTSNAVNRTFNFGLPSLLGNLTQAWYDFQPPPRAVTASRHVGVAAGLGLIGIAYVVCLLGAANRERQFSLLTLAMLAGSATMWGHYLVMLVFPGVVAALSVSQAKSLLPKAVVAAAVLMILMAGTGTPLPLAGLPILNVALHYLPLAAVMALAMLLARHLLFGPWRSAVDDLPASGLKVMFLRPHAPPSSGRL